LALCAGATGGDERRLYLGVFIRVDLKDMFADVLTIDVCKGTL